MEYDVFISHASEDKADIARPLAAHLQKLGLRVWLDEFELTLGDSLRRKIDHGLSKSRYGLVILSPAFFSKEWPNKELDGLVAREDGREKVVLPVWHNVSAADIVKFSPMLAGKVAVSTSRGLTHVADRVYEAVQRTSPGENIQTVVMEDETELLRRLRKEMLLSRSSRELRGSLYELEARLANYPHSPEARLLKDDMQTAILHAERKIPPPQARRPKTLTLFLFLAVLGLLVGLLVYTLLRILGVL
jgi:TIR domain